MKKLLIINVVLSSIVLFAINACKKNNLVVDKDVTPPSYAKFNVRQAADTAGTYYVASSGLTYKIPIGLTTVSDKDRTIQLCYTSTSAVAGAQYNAPATVVIPAGKAVDTLVIQGLYSGYPSSSRVDVVYVKICGGDVPASAYWSTYKLTMRKYCDVSLASFAGDYNNVIDNGNYGPYYVAIVPGTTSGTTGTLLIDNIWDPGVPVTTTVNLDWTDPSNFKVTIPDQVYYGAADWWIVGTSAGTFSSCNQTFTLRYKLYNKSTGATLYNNQVTTIAR